MNYTQLVYLESGETMFAKFQTTSFEEHVNCSQSLAAVRGWIASAHGTRSPSTTIVEYVIEQINAHMYNLNTCTITKILNSIIPCIPIMAITCRLHVCILPRNTLVQQGISRTTNICIKKNPGIIEKLLHWIKIKEFKKT